MVQDLTPDDEEIDQDGKKGDQDNGGECQDEGGEGQSSVGKEIFEHPVLLSSECNPHSVSLRLSCKKRFARRSL